MTGSAGWRAFALGGATLVVVLTTACVGLWRFLGVEAPRFEMDSERESVLSLDPASVLTARPVATVRIWTRVTNPNNFNLTLSRLSGNLLLEGSEMAEIDLPLGLPLVAQRDTVIPLEIRFGLPALSALGALGEALLRGRAVSYRLDGTLGVDAGALGEPTFGPRTWLQGQVDVRALLDDG